MGKENFQKCRRGSITVECSIAMPLFLFLTLCMFSLLEMIHIHGKMNAALHAAARELSVYSYALEESGWDWSGIDDRLIGLAGAETFVRTRMISILGREWIENSLIVGKEAGIHYYRSGMDWEEQEIDLVVNYQVRPFITFAGLGKLQLMNRCRVKMWTGYSYPSDGEDVIVYVTKTGEAYHRSLFCSYLNPSIRQVAYDEAGKRRNSSGGKYYPCELCMKETESRQLGYVYLTDYGDRYHTSLCCKSLKRTIKKIRLSEAGNRHACSKCGGKG